MQNNSLVGTVPESLGNLKNLKFLWVMIILNCRLYFVTMPISDSIFSGIWKIINSQAHYRNLWIEKTWKLGLYKIIGRLLVDDFKGSFIFMHLVLCRTTGNLCLAFSASTCNGRSTGNKTIEPPQVTIFEKKKTSGHHRKVIIVGTTVGVSCALVFVALLGFIYIRKKKGTDISYTGMYSIVKMDFDYCVSLKTSMLLMSRDNNRLEKLELCKNFDLQRD